MSTIKSCKNCGVQIEYKDGFWMEVNSSKQFPKHCGTGSGETWSLHELFVPEELDIKTDWEKQMFHLLEVMKDGDSVKVSYLACDMFITLDGKPNRAAINQFEAFAPCKIGPGEQDSFGWLTGIIAYNGKKFMFG